MFYHRLLSAFSAASPVEVTLTAELERAHEAGSALVGRDPMIEVQALDYGDWGERLRISVQDEESGLVSRTTIRSIIDATHIRLASNAGVESGTVLEVTDPLDEDAVVGEPVKVTLVDTSSGVITLGGTGLSAAQQSVEVAAAAAGRHAGIHSRELRITVYLLRTPDPAMPSRNGAVIDSEDFRHLSMDPRHSRYLETIIGATDGEIRLSDGRPEGSSRFIRVHDLASDADKETTRLGPETLIDILPNGTTRSARHALTEGEDSIDTLTDVHYIGDDAADPDDRTGRHSLRNIEEISLVAVPGQIGVEIQQALIDHC
jgi:hypothetical protein